MRFFPDRLDWREMRKGSIYEDKPKMNWKAKEKAIDELVGEIGSLSENGGKVLNEAAKSIEHMVGKKAALEFGETLEELRREPQQYSLVFKDKGLRLRAMSAIAEHGRVTEFPKDDYELFNEFEQYMNYCYTFMVSPTIGMFAVWLGISLEDWEDRQADYEFRRPTMAATMRMCKETIRGFIESQTMDGNIPPAVYLHQNKAYYDAVEKVEVAHTNSTDAHVRDSAQIQTVIDMLPDSTRRRMVKDDA